MYHLYHRPMFQSENESLNISVHKIKTMEYNTSLVLIIDQNENGKIFGVKFKVKGIRELH